MNLLAWWDRSDVWSGELCDELGRIPPYHETHTQTGRVQLQPGDGGGRSGGGGIGGGGGSGAPGAGAGAAAAGVSAAAGGGGTHYNEAVWLFPPSDFLNLDVGPNPQTGAVALPAIGATTVILKYTVPNGRVAKIGAIGIDFILNAAAGTFTQGILPAQLAFQITVDNKPVAGFEQFNFLPGAVSSPTGTAGFFAKENQVVQITVKNISIAVTTQFLAARIQGYLLTKTMYQKILGY